MTNYKSLISAVAMCLFAVFMMANDNDKKTEGSEPLDLFTMEIVEYEEEIDLGFNPYYYLPHDFNPRIGMLFDINQIVVEDQEEEIDLGFDTKKYLPKDFNPYLGM